MLCTQQIKATPFNFASFPCLSVEMSQARLEEDSRIKILHINIINYYIFKKKITLFFNSSVSNGFCSLILLLFFFFCVFPEQVGSLEQWLRIIPVYGWGHRLGIIYKQVVHACTIISDRVPETPWLRTKATSYAFNIFK